VRFLLFARFSVFSIVLFSCGSYKQNIMFRPGDNSVPEPLRKEVLNAEKNYVIQKDDYLKLDVFSNKGERIIDPNPDLSQSSTTGTAAPARKEFTYLVDPAGIVRFPMIGDLHLEGLTLRQAEEIVQKEYQNFFKEPFVVLAYANKRVIVLGALGGQVIPLANQNIHLAEVLALAKGLDNNAKAHNIRVLRKDTWFQVDFSTIEGFRNGNLLIEPGDIVYVEPIRRPFSEGLRDNVGLVSLVVSLSTLLLIINTVK
jgi:polysaccharide export outer membrane protein